MPLGKRLNRAIDLGWLLVPLRKGKGFIAVRAVPEFEKIRERL